MTPARRWSAWCGFAGCRLAFAILLGASQGVASQEAHTSAVAEIGASGGAGPTIVSALTRATQGTADRSFTVGYERTKLIEGSAVREIASGTVSTEAVLRDGSIRFDMGLSGWSRRGSMRGLVGGFVETTFRGGAGTDWTVALTREPIWRVARSVDPLRALRVQDLAQLDERWGASELSVTARSGPPELAILELDLGATRFGDDNRRLAAFARSSMPVVWRADRSVSLGPRVYAETFSRSIPGFLTHARYLSLGVELRAHVVAGPTTFRFKADPHLFAHDSGAGLAIGGALESSVDLGVGALDWRLSFLQEGDDAFLQIASGLSLPVS
jgi:hypothetical protein